MALKISGETKKLHTKVSQQNISSVYVTVFHIILNLFQQAWASLT